MPNFLYETCAQGIVVNGHYSITMFKSKTLTKLAYCCTLVSLNSTLVLVGLNSTLVNVIRTLVRPITVSFNFNGHGKRLFLLLSIVNEC